MPSNITKYRIFLASPDDLLDDRACVNEVINELNLSLGNQHNITLELIKWETHSAPAISLSHVQDVINKDLSDFDLFIGLLWKKFGTPTKSSNSGTEEEFTNAYRKFIKDPFSVQILFYFKTAPVPFTEIDPEQIKKIKDFKLDISKNKNLLYWEYQDVQQLSKFLRIHIPHRILEFHKYLSTTASSEEIIISNKKEIEEELGLIDYQEKAEEYLRGTNDSLERITVAVDWIGEQIGIKADELGTLNSKKTQISRKTLRDFYLRTAKVMDNFTDRITPEISIFYENFELLINSYSNIINIYMNDFNTEDTDETEQALEDLVSEMSGTIDSINSFLQSVKDMPRMSKELNNAKLNMSVKIESLLTNLAICQSLTTELLKSLQ